MSTFNKIEMDLDFAIAHHKNVLLVGESGCGKTQVIMKKFKKAFPGKWKYYSTPTMDVWVDMIGCPRVVREENGNDYLKLVRPREWEDDQIEAIFLDEANRAPAKVKNALMELLLFKSLNGKKFNNLKVIWAAINPDTEEYQTEELDRAHIDRFDYQIQVPYEVNYEYFAEKFGEETAEPACAWWKSLDSDKKKLVSPRRLDKALEIIKAGGDINNVLDKSTNPGKLLKEITSGSSISELLKILKKNPNNKKEVLEKFFESENHYFNTKDFIMNKDNTLLEYINDERLSEVISNNEKIRDYTLQNLANTKYYSVVEDIIKANNNKELVENIQKNNYYQTYQIEKDENNPELIENEKILAGYATKKGDKQYEFHKPHDFIFNYIKKNKDKFVGSSEADEIITVIYELDDKKYPEIPSLQDHIRHFGL